MAVSQVTESRKESARTRWGAGVEQHPPSVGARAARALRMLRGVRGWERVTALAVPQSTSGRFVVRNPTGYFAGDLSSFIDRRMYLFGEYEGDSIRQFLSFIPTSRRGVVLDVGANVGTHSLAFASAFAKVHAFEPNPALWQSFEANMRLNGLEKVRLHKLALADRDGELPFFTAARQNFGLGTLSGIQQYDRPLQPSGTVNVVQASRYLEGEGVGRVDAVKIDVQGFEPEVIRGLSVVLERDRPIVWFEVGSGTRAKIGSADVVKAFPFAGELYRFEAVRGALRNSVRLGPAPAGSPPNGDYLMVPEGFRDG
jgi:FkbM family methyltransferase